MQESPLKRRSKSPIDTTPDPLIPTGEHCPRSGWWLTASEEQEAGPSANARFISEGSLMPAVEGSPTKWLPTRKAD
jgi:hypothetical protein